jgi:hypothetical protein
VVIQAPTYASDIGGKGCSINQAATLAIEDAPHSGTGAYVSDALALWVQAGAALFAADVTVGGTLWAQTSMSPSAEFDALLVGSYWPSAAAEEARVTSLYAHNATVDGTLTISALAGLTSLSLSGAIGAGGALTGASANITNNCNAKSFTSVGHVDCTRAHTDTLNTTDGTVTTLASFQPVNYETFYIIARVVGHRADGTEGACAYSLAATFKRTTGGVTAIVGSCTVMSAHETVAGWDATIDTDGAYVRVRVTGAVGTTLHWQSWSDIWEVT